MKSDKNTSLPDDGGCGTLSWVLVSIKNVVSRKNILISFTSSETTHKQRLGNSYINFSDMVFGDLQFFPN